ncbi:RGPS2-like protein [Mya arenaria]|uniref:RGPS2-like protein n=1 Tax=Mya arenaria TaxID=6604 RepID=A0ABY7GBN8_MYAAR|nr:RGPS2-like protein [Mya arenaria]
MDILQFQELFGHHPNVNTMPRSPKMSIPHRILATDGTNKPLSMSFTESDSSGDYKTAMSSIVDGGSHGSEESLDKHSSLPRMKSYDAAVFDVLRVPPEEFAVNFWVQREILTTQTDKTRAEVLAHFIKIGKKLLDLNNLHAVMAVVSALQSAAIFRLSKTWTNLSKKDKSTYEKMADLFSENDNRQKLRDYMANVKLPCIPYLGLYLTDLIYIDVAHPHHGGMESHHRRLQMNNILRVIADLQQSAYELEIKEHVQNYLKSVRYIEELQKFVEDDNYKLSLKLEPPQTIQSVSTSREDISKCPPSPTNEPRIINALTPGPAVYSRAHQSGGHRKSKSLSANFLSCTSGSVERTHSLPPKTTAPYLNGVRHLLDDSVLEESPCASSDGSLCKGVESEEICSLHLSEDSGKDYQQSFTCQGCLRRKTVLKEGRKPTVAAWSRYWVALWGTNLLYFPAKNLRGVDRNSFKTNPSKMTSVVGWMVVMGDNPLQPDAFQLTDPVRGNVYKFRAGSQAQALVWCRHLSEASKKFQSRTQPSNLMSFD